MNILIIGNLEGHIIFKEYCDQLINNDIDLKILDIWNFRFYDWKSKKLLSQLKNVTWLFSIPKIRVVVRYIYEKYFTFYSLQKNKFDIVAFHYASPIKYLRIINLVKKKTKKIALVIWGSDLLRREEKNEIKFCKLILSMDIVICGSFGLQDKLLLDYPQIKEKSKVVFFGSYFYDIMKEIKSQNYGTKNIFKVDNRILITCGYNANTAQRHLKILDALYNIKSEILNKTQFILPMTYYEDQEGYIDMVKVEFSKSNLNYIVLDSKLLNEDIAKLRMETDLVINIQTTDSFSGSIREHLYAGNVVLVGDWLPYDYLEERGVFYLKTSLEDLAENIAYCINNIDELKKKCVNNPDIVYSFSSWNNVINDWIKTFEDLVEGRIGN